MLETIIFQIRNTVHWSSGITHMGIFHADDVFCAALLKLVFGDDFQVRRVPRVTEEYPASVVVFDIGGGKFDHHLPVEQQRKYNNGVAYASFGLLSEYLLQDILPEYNRFHMEFVYPIDKWDTQGGGNGEIEGMTLSQVIASMNMNPVVQYFGTTEAQSQDERFDFAVNTAKVILQNQLLNHLGQIRLRGHLSLLIPNGPGTKSVIKTERFIPLMDEQLGDWGIRARVYPDARTKGDFDVLLTRGTPVSDDLHEQVSKSEACAFAHPGRFMYVFHGSEAAMEFAEKL